MGENISAVKFFSVEVIFFISAVVFSRAEVVLGVVWKGDAREVVKTDEVRMCIHNAHAYCVCARKRTQNYYLSCGMSIVTEGFLIIS